MHLTENLQCRCLNLNDSSWVPFLIMENNKAVIHLTYFRQQLHAVISHIMQVLMSLHYEGSWGDMPRYRHVQWILLWVSWFRFEGFSLQGTQQSQFRWAWACFVMICYIKTKQETNKKRGFVFLCLVTGYSVWCLRVPYCGMTCWSIHHISKCCVLVQWSLTQMV